MKRFVATTRWRDVFWNELHPYPKIVLCYMYDTANASGFIDYSPDLWLTQLQGKIDTKYSKFTKKDLINSLVDLQSKLLKGEGKQLYIKDFLFHQNKLPLVSGVEEDDWIIAKLKNNLEKFNNAKEIQTILDSVVDSSRIEKTEEINSKKKVKEKFQIPTKEEFNQRYLALLPTAHQHNIDDLYDHYVSNGWKVGGKTPIQDLDACIRKAIRRADKYKNSFNNDQENKKTRTESTLSAVDRIIEKNNAGK